MEKFIIIDGNSMANRAFYAMPEFTNRSKQPSGAVFGFAKLLVKLIEQQKPDKIAVAFDHARKTFRNEIFPDYKGTRKETPPDLISQFPVIKEMLDKMNVTFFESAGIEADDIIGTLAKNSGCENIIVSSDRDLLQLIDEHTTVFMTIKGVSEIEKMDEAALKEKYGLSPAGIVDLKALMGDASDNIPGVTRVGEKTALSLLGQFKTLEGVYQNLDKIKGSLHDNLEKDRDKAFMSKTLATIKTDCQLPQKDCTCHFPFSQEVRDFFADWSFRSLMARKDIYAEGVSASRAQKICLDSMKSLQNLKKPCKFFCYDLKELEFSFGGGEVFYIKKEYDLFCDIFDLDSVLLELKPIFEDENVVKITNYSKDDIKILGRLGIKLCNFFDIEIARYVLYAGLPIVAKAQVENFVSEREKLIALMRENDVTKVYENIEIPLVRVLASMEEEGFKVDEACLAEQSATFRKQLAEVTQKIYELAGEEFNLNSPKQVARILFDKLGLKTFNNKKQSTSEAVLEEISWQHEIVGQIMEYRKISKIVNTYLNVYENICKTSGNVIHTVFNQTLTATGRLSSSEPNMQNIPTRQEQGRNLRKIFISKFEGGQIVSADYNQIELRLLANLAEEDSMIDAYRHGVDIHAKTASEIFGVPVEEVTREQRGAAKAVNFGIIYGMGEFGLSQSIKTSRDMAKKYIESYFDRYPKIKTFMDKNVQYAREHTLVKSYFGRIRHVGEIASSNGNTRRSGERIAMNTPLQATASDVIKIAMVRVFERLKGMKSHLILQIHDELIVDAPKEEVEEVKKILVECMEGVCDFAVPLSVSVGSGENLFKCK